MGFRFVPERLGEATRVSSPQKLDARAQHDLGSLSSSCIDIRERLRSCSKRALLNPIEHAQSTGGESLDRLPEIRWGVAVGTCERDFLKRDLADIQTFVPGQ